jgi:hypothetical protein
MADFVKLAVVGGGPAGLRAAEVAASCGAKVTIFDAKPSVGRKFLVAGRGGLNITHEEPVERFLARFRSGEDPPHASDTAKRALWRELLAQFGPEALRNWARSLGVETFVASTGRVYPEAMKSAPLLRRWVERLRKLGVEFRMRHHLRTIARGSAVNLGFELDGAFVEIHADAAVLALGGGSWSQTGSTGEWVEMLRRSGIDVRHLAASNCGWEVDWPEDFKERFEGRPLKNVSARAGAGAVRGELLVTRYGLEGGAIYALTSSLHAMSRPVLTVDFKPDSSVESLVARLGSARRNYLEEGGARWRLGDVAMGLLTTLRGGIPFGSPFEAAEYVKGCPICLRGPRPVEEAISTAGGVVWSELDDALMLRRLPGVFLAGEMLDWDAPTGGYLMQGCFSTGTRAGECAATYLSGL